jgi:hypothetical protein
MRTTVRIDDDLLRRLKEHARRENVSLASVVNRTIRRGLSGTPAKASKKRFRQKTYSMGVPLVDLTKALAVAAALEDEERIAKMSLGR